MRVSENDSDLEIGNILDNILGISDIGSQNELYQSNVPFQDKYATEEQNKRDKQITRLLEAYVDNYKGKTNSNRKYKKVIFTVAMSIVIVFSLLMVCTVKKGVELIFESPKERTIPNGNIQASTQETIQDDMTNNCDDNEIPKLELSISALSGIITACVSYLVLVFGLLNIITKYVFPKKEEKYITDIVKVIQSNDLANKRENMRTDGFDIDGHGKEDKNIKETSE